MRATLDIDDDVLQAARDLAEREGRTAGKVLSDLARRGLAAPVRVRKNRTTTRGRVPVLPSRGGIVTVEHIQRLRDKEGI